MRKRMNERARPGRKIWHQQAPEFIIDIWSAFPTGYGFVAARSVRNKHWQETCFPVDACRDGLEEFFSTRSRRLHDFYFCPNAFWQSRRKASCALPTPYAWVDIDEGDVNAFDPQPSVLICTSPGRHQGIWWFDDNAAPRIAEHYSRALAYNFEADRNGWSTTKMLRVPDSINHKPEYNQPIVKLVHCDWRPIVGRPKSFQHTLGEGAGSRLSVRPNRYDSKDVVEKYRRRIPRPVIRLVEDKRVARRDRSARIFEIITAFHKAGATPDEIASVLWGNVYFLSKHGRNRDRLSAEISRVVSKLEGHS